MLWSADPWFTSTFKEAQQARLKGNPALAESLYRSLYERAIELGEPETVRKARMEWISFLGSACRYEEARLESERFLSELDVVSDRLIRAEVEYYLANFSYYLNEYDRAIELAGKILSSLSEQESPSLEARVYNMLALSERHIGLYEQAIEHFHEAVLILKKNNLSDDGGYDGNLALLYEDKGRYSDAIESYQVCLSKAKRIKSEEMTTFATMGIGTVYHKLGRFAEARFFLSEALIKAENMENPILTQNVHAAISELALEEFDLVAAFDHATAALLMAQEAAIPELEADARIVNGKILLQRGKHGDFEAALNEAKKASEIHTELGLSYGVALALNLESEVLMALGRSDEALTKALDSVTIGEEFGEDMDSICSTAARILESAGRKEEAKALWDRAHEVVQEKASGLTKKDKESFLARPFVKRVTGQDH